MTDIIEEIINEEKDAKRLYYFRKFLPMVIVGSVIAVCCMAGYNYYQAKKEEHTQKMSDMLVDLLTNDINDSKVLDSSLQDLVNNSGNNLSELAMLEKALLQFEENQEDSGIKILEEIIANKSLQDTTTAYARILWLSRTLDKEHLTDESKAKTVEYLQFFNNDKKVFFASASLLKALFYFKNKQIDLAKVAAEEILNTPNIPASIREQAYGLITSIKYKNY